VRHPRLARQPLWAGGVVTDEPRTYLGGWCATHGTPDQFHNQCEGEFTTTFGVRWVCRCPNHDQTEAADGS
jgi:hypothetical protein